MYIIRVVVNTTYYFLKGSEKMANDTKNNILNGYLPSGLYYYFIPSEDPIHYSGFLGNAPCVETVTYNPFISKNDLKSVIETTFDEDRFGDIDSNTNKLIRVKHIDARYMY